LDLKYFIEDFRSVEREFNPKTYKIDMGDVNFAEKTGEEVIDHAVYSFRDFNSATSHFRHFNTSFDYARDSEALLSLVEQERKLYEKDFVNNLIKFESEKKLRFNSPNAIGESFDDKYKNVDFVKLVIETKQKANGEKMPSEKSLVTFLNDARKISDSFKRKHGNSEDIGLIKGTEDANKLFEEPSGKDKNIIKVSKEKASNNSGTFKMDNTKSGNALAQQSVEDTDFTLEEFDNEIYERPNEDSTERANDSTDLFNNRRKNIAN